MLPGRWPGHRGGAQAAEPAPFEDEPEPLDAVEEEPDVDDELDALDEDELDDASEELEDSPLAAGTLAEEPERESVR